MTATGAERLLRNLVGVPELVPEFWNVNEPIDKPFIPSELRTVIYGSMVPSGGAQGRYVSTLAFLARRTAPQSLISIDLRLGPVQWGTAHNRVTIQIEEPWPGGESKLAHYLPSSILPDFPDYGRIVESSQEDTARLQEFRRSLTPAEFLQSIRSRAVTAPFGPYGCLEDIYWFNYFGRAYVDFIGMDRLLAAGWAHVERVGDGLACYASEAIDAPSSRRHRSRIAARLEEFVWTPGCKPESKRIPTFDFSVQSEALRSSAPEHIPGEDNG
jgi:hypothetical protein